MNYTSLKIGFTLIIVIVGISFISTIYNGFTSIVEKQAEKIEQIYNF